MGLLMAGYCMGGRLETDPSSGDTTRLTAILALPGMSAGNHRPIHLRIVDAVDQLKTEFVDPGTGEPLVRNISLSQAPSTRKRVQSISGIRPSGSRSPGGSKRAGPRNSVIANRWAEIIGPIPKPEHSRVFESTLQQGEYNEDNLNLNCAGRARRKSDRP